MISFPTLHPPGHLCTRFWPISGFPAHTRRPLFLPHAVLGYGLREYPVIILGPPVPRGQHRFSWSFNRRGIPNTRIFAQLAICTSFSEGIKVGMPRCCARIEGTEKSYIPCQGWLTILDTWQHQVLSRSSRQRDGTEILGKT